MFRGNFVDQSKFKGLGSMGFVAIYTKYGSSQPFFAKRDGHRATNQAQTDYRDFHFEIVLLSEFRVLRPVSPNFLMRSSASRNFSSVAQREIRMNCFPSSPKINPGVMNTFVA